MTTPERWEKSSGRVQWLTVLKPKYWTEAKKLLKGNDVFLEAGCGVGRKLFTLALDRRVRYAVGLDFSRHMLKIAKRFKSEHKIVNTCLVLGDIRCFPFKEGAFNLILSLGVVEHFLYPETLINEMGHALKVDGHLLIVTPNKKSLGTTKSWVYRAEKIVGKQDLYSPRELAFLVKKCNMHVVKAYSDDFGSSVATLVINRIPGLLPNLLRDAARTIIRLSFHILNPVMKDRGFSSIVVARKTK